MRCDKCNRGRFVNLITVNCSYCKLDKYFCKTCKKIDTIICYTCNLLIEDSNEIEICDICNRRVYINSQKNSQPFILICERCKNYICSDCLDNDCLDDCLDDKEKITCKICNNNLFILYKEKKYTNYSSTVDSIESLQKDLYKSLDAKHKRSLDARPWGINDYSLNEYVSLCEQIDLIPIDFKKIQDHLDEIYDY